MSKAYFIIFGILLALPIVIAASAVTYFCFKLSTLAGFISIAGCVIAIIAAWLTVHFKIKNIDRGDN